MSKDGEYFSRRAVEEREAASHTTNSNARRTHLDLAEAYERKARALHADERRSSLQIVSG